MHSVGFEPTPLSRPRPERGALDRSAKNAVALGCFDQPTSGLWAQHASPAPQSCLLEPPDKYWYTTAHTCTAHCVPQPLRVLFIKRISLQIHKVAATACAFHKTDLIADIHKVKIIADTRNRTGIYTATTCCTDRYTMSASETRAKRLHRPGTQNPGSPAPWAGTLSIGLRDLCPLFFRFMSN